MPITKIEFKPGIHRESTQYAEQGAWYDCDKVRFRFGRPEKIGGWLKATSATFKGIARVLMDWVLLDGKKCLFIGTHKKAYIEQEQTFYDITPIRFTNTNTSPILTGAAGTTIHSYTTSAPHGASVGDFVTLSGASSLDGISADEFNTEHEILSIPTASSFTFATSTAASAGTTAGGGTVTATFQLSIGSAINITGLGWGTGHWSRNAWGDPFLLSLSSIPLRIWSVDNFGEDLVFCPRDGQLYYWDATNGFSTRGVLVSSLPGASDVPTQTSIVRVTDNRHTIAFGCTSRVSGDFDPLLVRWSAQEDVANWTPSATNTAGSLRVPLGSYIVAALVARQETLIWTDHSLHSMQFVGPPFVFGIQTLAETCDIVGPNAAVNINNVTYWMGQSRFWVYSGRVQNLKCSVQRFIFENLNVSQLPQVYASSNDEFTEVTWYYCSKNSNTIDRYVTYNYGEDVWTYGSMGRTAMLQVATRSGAMYGTADGVDNDGKLYLHEVGYNDGSTEPASPITAFIESADFDVEDGNKLIFADRVLPDFSFDRSTSEDPAVTVTVEARKFAGQAIQSSDARVVSKTVTATVDQHTKQLWVRLRGRQMRLKIVSSGLGVCWLLGALRVNFRIDGQQ